MKIRVLFEVDEIRRAAVAALSGDITSDYYDLGKKIMCAIEEKNHDYDYFEKIIWADSALNGWYVERPVESYKFGMEREFYPIPDGYDMDICDPDDVARDLIEAEADYDRLFDILNYSTQKRIYNEFVNFAAANDMLV